MTALKILIPVAVLAMIVFGVLLHSARTCTAGSIASVLTDCGDR